MIGLRVVKPKAELVTPEDWFEKIPWLIEYCGRKSHKSEARMKDGSSDAFIKKVVRRLGHESIIEHMGITYDIVCSRACSHQLVRHRIAAYTQESMRFCDYGKGDDHILNIIVPPSIASYSEGSIIFKNTDSQLTRMVHDSTGIEDHFGMSHHEFGYWFCGRLQDYKDYLRLREAGIPPEDARFSLPIACKTEVATTFNLRMWRHVFEQRALNKHAQWEIKGIFQWILQDLANRLPMVFGDLVPF